MIADFLFRLAVALPLLLLLAVGLMLLLRRGLLPGPADAGAVAGPLGRLAARLTTLAGARPDPAGEPAGRGDRARLDVVACRAVLPGLRVVVVRYGGHDLVLGAGPQGLSLLSSLPAPVAAPAPVMLSAVAGEARP